MDYGYINARIRGMKSQLMDHQTLDGLTIKPDLDSLIAELEKTPYREEITEAKVQLSGVLCIESALRKNFVRTFRKILGFAEGQEAEQYIGIFLHRWDVQNIKTILRGKNIHVTNEEIMECLVPAGELDETSLAELVKQPDIRGVIDTLATWQVRYSKPLTEQFNEFSESGDLAVLECSLDRYHYNDSLKSVAGKSYNKVLIRDLLATEIDIVNIKTLLRMIRDRVDPNDTKRFLLEGGSEFDMEALERLAALPSLEDLIGEMVMTPYRFLTEVPENIVKHQKISVLEKHLEKYLVQEGVGAFAGDPLSVSLVIGYFWAKYNEITNIRIISRCKTAEVPDKQLKEELVYV